MKTINVYDRDYERIMKLVSENNEPGDIITAVDVADFIEDVINTFLKGE